MRKNTSSMLAIGIIFTMILSIFSMIIPSPVKAFPTYNPIPSQYIFYDDFESTGVPNWTVNPINYPPFTTTQKYHGQKSLIFDCSLGLSRQILRFFTNNSNTINEQIVIETSFYDDAVIITARADLFMYNDAGSWIGLGVNTAISQRLYSYWVSDAGVYTYQHTGVERTTGWHNFKIMINSHSDYSYFIDNIYVGNTIIQDNTGMLGYGVTNWNGGTLVSYVDQFLIYQFHQDKIWNKIGNGINNNKSWNSYLAIEPSLMYDNGMWRMWYDAINNSDTAVGTLGYATSLDGINWTDYSHNPLISLGVGYRPFVTKIGNIYYIYNTNETTDNFSRRTSNDGLNWSSESPTNLGISDLPWEDSHIGNIDVWKEGSTWYAIYEADGTLTNWKFGLATSTDGLNWIKNIDNPVSPDNMCMGGTDVHKIGSTYYIISHGLLSDWVNNVPSDIYIFESVDLVHWNMNTFFTQITRQLGNINEMFQVADPSYYSYGGKNLLAYEGTYDGTDSARIYVSSSKYSLEDIVSGNIAQWGRYLIGDIGVKNNVTSTGKIWYSGINAMKGTFTNNLTVKTNGQVNITLTKNSETNMSWMTDTGNYNPVINYTISGLIPNTLYYEYVDGVEFSDATSDENGIINMNYTNFVGNHELTISNKLIIPIQYSSGIYLGLVVLSIIAPLSIGVIWINYRKDDLTIEGLLFLLISVLIACAVLPIGIFKIFGG